MSQNSNPLIQFNESYRRVDWNKIIHDAHHSLHIYTINLKNS